MSKNHFKGARTRSNFIKKRKEKSGEKAGQ